MPALSNSLQQALDQALTKASEASLEYATLEHLLLALTQDESAREVMSSCSVDVDALTRDLDLYIDALQPSSVLQPRRSPEPNPSPAFVRVVQRAILFTESIGRYEVSGAIALLSIFSERESRAAMLLAEHNVTRIDVVRFVHFGLRKDRIFRWKDPHTWSVLSDSLQNALHRAEALANDRHHNAITLEHLLLALLSEEHTCALLSAAGVDHGALSKDLAGYIDQELSSLMKEDSEATAEPSAACERLVQTAITRVSGPATVASVLASLVLLSALASLADEPVSYAGALLRELGLSHFDFIE